MDVKGGIVIMNIKKILTGVLAGAFLTTMTAFPAAAASEADNIKLGDPTGDGKINALDASDILSLYADVSVGGSELTDLILSLCDVNKDGAVNAMDASFVLSYYAAVETSETEQELEDFVNKLISEVQTWSWPDNYERDSSSPWNPWNPWDPASSLSPDYQIDPDVDWTSFLPEDSLDEESPWTWTGEETSPWNPYDTNDQQWGEWYNNVYTEDIDNWLNDTLDMLNEIEEPADTE